MNPLPISVFIITYNEEDRLPHTIQSCKPWADEIIVVDSGSTDRTRQIADEHGCKVLYHAWQGYGQQKIFAERQCRNDWVLNLDADEALSAPLVEELRALFAGDPLCDAYKMDIAMVLPHETRPHRLAVTTEAIRLYRRSKASFRESSVHDSVVPQEGCQVGKLKARVEHRSFRGLAHEIDKINHYTTQQARDMVAKDRRPGVLRLVVEPWFAFFKAYVIRRYAIYGVDGFVQSVIYSFSKTLRLAKTREQWQQHNRQNP